MTPRSFATITSGRDYEATLLDGTTLKLFVRQLPARHHLDFIMKQADEAELIELVCRPPLGEELPKGWSDALSDKSHLELVEIAKELNLTRAIATVDRGNAVAKILMPHRLEEATSIT